MTQAFFVVVFFGGVGWVGGVLFCFFPTIAGLSLIFRANQRAWWWISLVIISDTSRLQTQVSGEKWSRQERKTKVSDSQYVSWSFCAFWSCFWANCCCSDGQRRSTLLKHRNSFSRSLRHREQRNKNIHWHEITMQLAKCDRGQRPDSYDTTC